MSVGWQHCREAAEAGRCRALPCLQALSTTEGEYNACRGFQPGPLGE